MKIMMPFCMYYYIPIPQQSKIGKYMYKQFTA